jgi:hypothetical protein
MFPDAQGIGMDNRCALAGQLVAGTVSNRWQTLTGGSTVEDKYGLNDSRLDDLTGGCDDSIPFLNAFEAGDFEAAQALALVKIATQLERIADALEPS